MTSAVSYNLVRQESFENMVIAQPAPLGKIGLRTSTRSMAAFPLSKSRLWTTARTSAMLVSRCARSFSTSRLAFAPMIFAR